MAKIDLKYCYLRIKDGTVQAGAVNHGAGYSLNGTTMVVDGITGIIHNNRTFTVVGSSATHVVSGHAETGGNTTTLTFTPGLTGAVLDNAVITFGPNRLDVKLGEGNLTYSEKKNREYSKDRGKLDTVRDGDEEPMDIRMDFLYEFLRSTTGDELPTIQEALKKQGAASTWVSVSSDPCEPYAVDLELEYIPPCTGEDREISLFPDFRHESLDHDFKAGTVACSGKCNAIEPIITRVAQ